MVSDDLHKPNQTNGMTGSLTLINEASLLFSVKASLESLKQMVKNRSGLRSEAEGRYEKQDLAANRSRYWKSEEAASCGFAAQPWKPASRQLQS